MPSRSALAIFVGAVAVLGFSSCKPVYSDVFTYKKNSFKAPAVKQPEVKAPTLPLIDPGAPPAGVIPPAGPGGIPGAIPGAPAMPDAGGIPGVPPAAPGVPPAVPGVPPAVPPAPGL